jgi:hypothetical protein
MSNPKTFESEQAAAAYSAEHGGERVVVLRPDGSRVILANGRRTEIAEPVVRKAAQ